MSVSTAPIWNTSDLTGNGRCQNTSGSWCSPHVRLITSGWPRISDETDKLSDLMKFYRKWIMVPRFPFMPFQLLEKQFSLPFVGVLPSAQLLHWQFLITTWVQFRSARISSSEKPHCEEAPGSWPRSDLARGNRSDWSSERKLADDLLNKQLTLGVFGVFTWKSQHSDPGVARTNHEVPYAWEIYWILTWQFVFHGLNVRPFIMNTEEAGQIMKSYALEISDIAMR